MSKHVSNSSSTGKNVNNSSKIPTSSLQLTNSSLVLEDPVVINLGLTVTGDIESDSIYVDDIYEKTTDHGVSIHNSVTVTGDLKADNFLAQDGRVSVGGSAGIGTPTAFGAIAIGEQAGEIGQSDQSISIGATAGYQSQGPYAIAVGMNSGTLSQGSSAVAIGLSAGIQTQGLGAVSVGYFSGSEYQGQWALALGANAGRNNQAANSIVLNAQGLTPLEATTSGLFIAPIATTTSTDNILVYDTSTKEIKYTTGEVGNTGEEWRTDRIFYEPFVGFQKISNTDGLELITTGGNTWWCQYGSNEPTLGGSATGLGWQLYAPLSIDWRFSNPTIFNMALGDIDMETKFGHYEATPGAASAILIFGLSSAESPASTNIKLGFEVKANQQIYYFNNNAAISTYTGVTLVYNQYYKARITVISGVYRFYLDGVLLFTDSSSALLSGNHYPAIKYTKSASYNNIYFEYFRIAQTL